MGKDNQVITYLSPADMAALMTESGMVAVHDSAIVDGKPVIHAALKIVNAQTGEQLPGGLPFSIVMFKSPRDPGYTNIAIGTIVPASELNISLPRDYFNFCNQRFRFTRVFPLDERSFVLQMDLFVRNATREYIKFSIGLWAALFSQLLFELIGRGRESLLMAAETYAAAHTDLAQHYVETVFAEPVPLDAVAQTTPAEPVETVPAPEEKMAEEPASTAAEDVAVAAVEAVPVEAVAVEWPERDGPAETPVEKQVEEPAEPVDEVTPEKEAPKSALAYFHAATKEEAHKVSFGVEGFSTPRVSDDDMFTAAELTEHQPAVQESAAEVKPERAPPPYEAPEITAGNPWAHDADTAGWP